MSGNVVFCPHCGTARTGVTCTNCGYDYLRGSATPAVTTRRGMNPVSAAIIVFWIVVIAAVVLFVLR